MTSPNGWKDKVNLTSPRLRAYWTSIVLFLKIHLLEGDPLGTFWLLPQIRLEHGLCTFWHFATNMALKCIVHVLSFAMNTPNKLGYVDICHEQPYHAQPADNRVVWYKLNHVLSRFLYCSDFVTSRRLLFRPNMYNCTMAYIPHKSYCTKVCFTGACLDSSSSRF